MLKKRLIIGILIAGLILGMIPSVLAASPENKANMTAPGSTVVSAAPSNVSVPTTVSATPEGWYWTKVIYTGSWSVNGNVGAYLNNGGWHNINVGTNQGLAMFMLLSQAVVSGQYVSVHINSSGIIDTVYLY